MFKERKKKDRGGVGALLTGLLVCTVLLFSCLLIATLILYFGDDPTYRSELWSFGAFILSGAVSGAVICRMEGDGGLLIATLSAIELIVKIKTAANSVANGNPQKVGYIVANTKIFFGRRRYIYVVVGKGW